MAREFLLALDGDESTLRAIAQVAAPFYEVLTARDPRRFLKYAEAHDDAQVVVVEHVLADGDGVALLETVRTMRPGTRRVLTTTYHDLASIVAGIHSGAIEALVPKPFTAVELLGAVRPAGMKRAVG